MLIFTLSHYNKYTTMPRLSLYRPEKANDYRFIDRLVLEQFMVGGTDVYIHKYLGPKDPVEGESSPSQPTNGHAISELGIQDLLLLETRDRRYSDDIYVMRCIYNMQQLDWSLTQFGLFLANDTIFIHIHLNDSVKRIGRKLMAGDVIELPHLKDPYALNEATIALRRFYVVEDVLRPTEGFSQTWYPHLIKLKCKPLVDSQEFKDILDKPAEDPFSPYAGDDSSTALRDLISSFNVNMEINNAVIAQAEEDAPLSGYDTDSLWMVPVDPSGRIMLQDASGTIVDASQFYMGIKNDDGTWRYLNKLWTPESTTEPEFLYNANEDLLHEKGIPIIDASITLKSPRQNYYLGYLIGDSVPPNGYKLSGMGAQFPDTAVEGIFFLRTDFSPTRLFRFNGSTWRVFEDNVRMTLNNSSDRKTLKTSFINNKNQVSIGNKVIDERQPISKPLEVGKNLKPKADN
jgi:hypothetical protein